ncbi:MAG: hypothetical protein U0791_19575 [Gemmataceae bacterium]
MAVTVLSPLTGDTVVTPVTVIAGYSAAANFNLRCNVNGTTYETASQPHTAGSGVHTSTPITSAASPPAGWPVNAVADNAVGTGTQPGVIIVASGGQQPVGNQQVGIPPGGPGPLATGAAAGPKKRNISGECDVRSNVAYVIIRVKEVDVNTGVMVVVASGADTPKKAGAQVKWGPVQLQFPMDMADDSIQYVVQTTAYGLDDLPIGSLTTYFAK